MNYQVGSAGRVVVARLSDGDDVLAGLVKIARDEGIRAGVLWLIGGVKKGRAVVGPKEEGSLPPKPVWFDIEESHEVVATGTLFWEGDEPRVHLHGAFGKGDSVRAGCLRGESETFLVLEAVIMEIQGVKAAREMDPSVGLALLKV
ncbi:MAG: DNA-binding protein [Nitrospirota bacterium]|jgi:predicted DNA-binding protein with PD1-like motif